MGACRTESRIYNTNSLETKRGSSIEQRLIYYWLVLLYASENHYTSSVNERKSLSLVNKFLLLGDAKYCCPCVKATQHLQYGAPTLYIWFGFILKTPCTDLARRTLLCHLSASTSSCFCSTSVCSTLWYGWLFLWVSSKILLLKWILLTPYTLYFKSEIIANILLNLVKIVL